MREAAELFGLVCLYGGLFGLVALALGVFAVGFGYVFRTLRREFRQLDKATRAVAVAAVVLATMYGGSKTGRVEVNDPYITDAGSYVTNDYIHVSVAKRYDYLPDTMSILVFIREVAQTNAEDWVEVLPRHAFADVPFDIMLENATNYNALVAADYVPEPTVHTNGVWQIKGFIVPGTTNAASTGALAFPNTKTTTTEDD